MTASSLRLVPALALALGACNGTAPGTESSGDTATSGDGKSDLSASACTNFSGFWAGVCEDNLGTVDQVYFAFEQIDCSAIQTGLHPIVIGGENETEWKGSGFAVKRKDQAAWNGPDKSFLDLDVSLIRELTGGPTTEIVGTGTLELASADQLVLELDGILTTNGQQIPHHQVCTLELAAPITQ